ncbi:MAG: hypothetical protein COB26_02090 [Piscirickettsiaceae bacterium]|nr:MAG: hypothetical protein COB89_03690 [Piscirickettsiaceae bacterium]PCI70878.1 MAG: hypothetical protein COB26_02090 [Piscirickettsiaceae bacterium]
MAITIAAIIVIILGCIFYKKKSSSTEPTNRQDALIEKNAATLLDLQESDRFWGVYIHFDNEALCCKNVVALHRKQLSKKTALQLPLKDCDKSLCRCRYVGIVEKRHKTRREVNDRRDEIRYEEKNDRRLGNERRSGIWVHHDE